MPLDKVPPPSGPFHQRFQTEIVWRNVAFYLGLHLLALYAVLLVLTFQVKWQTCVLSYVLVIGTSQGILSGVHRYYSHKSYQARWPLQLFFVFWFTLAFQNSVWTWVRDHRQHHKYSDTDADPHNAARGFFFAHMGWLMMRKHPKVLEKGDEIDLTDIENDPLVMFQKRYYMPFYLVCSLLVAILLPVYGWEETLANAFFVPFILRTVIILHLTWFVNSAAHYFGTKPYDRTLWPSENAAVAAVTFGEGWHNYHHSFPGDYRGADFGYRDNTTTYFIDFLSRIGLAYDLKTVSDAAVKARALRTGDGSFPRHRLDEQSNPTEEREQTNKKSTNYFFENFLKLR
ncbi:acyl-CoA Delta(11) desaturase-like [Thrips palmi]|uniref:Acyl-CoA Delta(11) desaturase-like n=1 Tax=Thrips palmi TaxID=161013 RepID=A0A6P8ZY35_THRPL|nr:acyl-CoA Delta(11) desaturase-like [Thrips palmi]